MSNDRTHRLLARALAARFSPLASDITSMSITPWESVTFSGARHQWAVTVSGDGAWPAAKAFSRTLAEAEFDLPGNIVADIAVTAMNRADPQTVSLRVEALTVGCA